MDPSLVIDEQETYHTSRVADLFGVTRQTVQNWTDNNTLNCTRDQDDNRVFSGRSLIADINDSKKLRDKLREAEGLDVQDETYASKLENKVIEQDDRIETLEEEKQALRAQYEDIIELLKNQLEQKDEQIRFLENQLEAASGRSLESQIQDTPDRSDPSLLRMAARKVPVLGRLVS